jgi:hypothetical protein
MKKKLILVLVFFIAVTAFCVVRDLVIRGVVGVVTTNVVGAPTHIGGFSLSILRQSVKITDFKMYSPPGFPHEVMVDIPLAYVSCDIFSFFSGKIHLKELTFNLKELTLTTNKEGKSNVNSLKIVEEGKGKKFPKLPPMQMDLIQLNIGRIVEKDYSVHGPLAIKVHDVDIKRTYKNVNSLQQLIALLIAEPLKAAGINKLSQYGVSMLTGVAALPVAVAFTLAAKDYARQGYNASWSKAYEVSLSALKEAGTVKSENKETGIISAEVMGAQITLKLAKLSWFKTLITISARRFLLPQPEVAGGVMYRISDKLK